MTARSISVTYGGLTIGAGQGSSVYTLTGVFSHNESYRRASVSFDVAVSAATPGAYRAAVNTLRAAFTTIDSRLTVSVGGTLHDYNPDPDVNTGFNHRATISKQPEMATDRSGIYTCSVECELPADRTGRGARLDSSVDVSETPSGRRTVAISGSYTAISNSAARAQFEAEVENYAVSVLDSILGADRWELVEAPQAVSDDQNKLLTFRRVYREIMRDQAPGQLNLAAVVNPKLVLKRRIPQANSALSVEEAFRGSAPSVLTAQYTSAVRFSETTDLRDLWENTLRQYVLDEIQSATGANVLVVTEEEWDFDQDENVLSATLSCVSSEGANFWQMQVEWNENQNSGIVLRPVWDGNPFSRDTYQGIASHTLQVSYHTLGPVEGMQTSVASGALFGAHPEPREIPNFLHVRTSTHARERGMGIAGNEIAVYVAATNYFYVRAEKPERDLTRTG